MPRFVAWIFSSVYSGKKEYSVAFVEYLQRRLKILLVSSSQEQGKAAFFGKQKETHSECLDFNFGQCVLAVPLVKDFTNASQSWRLFPA